MPTVVYTAIWALDTEVTDVTTSSIASHTTPKQRAELLQSVVVLAMEEMMRRRNARNAYYAPGTDFKYLFITPEYYFSQSQGSHLLKEKQKDAIMERLWSLATRFPELILISGSIPYYKNRPIGVDKYGNGTSQFVARNSTYVMRGSDNFRFKYNKLTDAAEVNPNESLGGRIEYARGDRQGLFAIDDIGAGIEICADHASGQLAAHGFNNLDLHIVISASTSIVPDNVCARSGGYVLHANASSLPSVYCVTRDHHDEITSLKPNGTLGDEVFCFESLSGLVSHKLLKKKHAEVEKSIKQQYKPLKSTNRMLYQQQVTRKVSLLMNRVGGTMQLWELPL